MRRLWVALLFWLFFSHAAQAAPAAAKTPTPLPVCTVVVHVVVAGSDKGVGDIPVTILKSTLKTSEDGVARFVQVPNHLVSVLVGSDTPRRVAVTPNVKKAVDLTIPIVVSVTLVVQTSAEGEGGGVNNASVSLDKQVIGTTNSQGQISVRVRMGTHRIRITHPAWQFVPSVVDLDVDGLSDPCATTFEARPLTGRIRIHLQERLAASLVPLAGAVVELQRVSDGRTYQVQGGPDGTALTEPLLLDRYLVRVHADGVTFPDGTTVILTAPGEVWTTLTGSPTATAP